eukprot:9321580-Ditylum_brightwellii.AAC.1
MYFVVSDWFFDHVNNKFSFSEDFIKSLVPTTPTDIEDTMKNDLVKVIENVQNNYVQTIKPIMVDGVLKFEATLGNCAQEMVSDKWLKENVCTCLLYTSPSPRDPKTS